MTMEYADTINSATFAAAVRLTRELQAERGEPVAASAAEAVSRTFCACVTDGEDAAEQHFSDIHRQLIEEVIARVRLAETRPLEKFPMSDSDSSVLEPSQQRLMALSRWDNEGGAVSDSAQPTSALGKEEGDVPELTNAELVQLRIRVIALENVMITLLAGASDRQLDLVREMAATISPRPGFTQHPLTIHAATQMNHLVDRAGHFRVEPAC